MTPRTGGAGARARAARVTAVAEPVVRGAGFDLEDVTVSRVGRRHLVRLVIDRDAGVHLDAAADVSRSVSRALDDAEAAGGTLFDGEYVLEVSSPGTDRPLTEPRHWWRNVGRVVTAHVAADGGESQVTGRVVAADESAVTLRVDGTDRRLPHHAVRAGRVQVELRRMEEAAENGAGEGEPR